MFQVGKECFENQHDGSNLKSNSDTGNKLLYVLDFNKNNFKLNKIS